MCVVGVARDGHALEQLVRVFIDDLLVLERAGLGFVGVADEVDGLGVLGGVDEAPLRAAGKAGTTASAQAGNFDLLHDVGAFHGEGLFQHLVAVVLQVAVEIDGVAIAVDVFEDESIFGGRHKGRTKFPNFL